MSDDDGSKDGGDDGSKTTSTTSSSSTSDPDDIESKSSHFQIVAPSFGNTALVPSDGNTSTPMTTFIRFGSATDADPASTYGAQLLDVALASSPIAVGNQVFDALTTAASGVSDISDGCQALATAVVNAVSPFGGDTSTARIATIKRLAQAAATAASDAATQADKAAGDDAATTAADASSAALSAAQSVAVYAAIGPFVDDTRDQGVDNNANGLSHPERVIETQRLFTKGGWRDHTDGNRISTTYGDKIDVVRGNYKLVVLGRQDSPSNGHTWESSGGMFQDNDAAPGQLTEIEWVETQQGTWRTIETCSKGDVLTQFDGHVTERFVGGSVTSVVGREVGATTSSEPSAAANDQLNKEWQEDKANNFIDPNLSFSAYCAQRGYGSGSKLADNYYAEGTGNPNPAVYEQTWASKIESYTGSTNCWVPTITETTYAKTITETTHVTTLSSTTNATDITENTTAATITETVTASGAIQSTTKANAVAEITDVNGKSSGFLDADTSGNKIVSKVFADLMHDEFHVTAATEYNLGTKWELVIGIWGTLKIGASVEIFLGPAFAVSGAKYEVAVVEFSACALKAENEPTKFEDVDFSAKTGALNILLTGIAMVL